MFCVISDIEEKEHDSGQVWDPSAKATKSILKVKTKKPQSDDKKVKFAKIQHSDNEDDDEDGEEEEENRDTDEEDGGESEESASDMPTSDDDSDTGNHNDKLPVSDVSMKRKRDDMEDELKEDIYGRLRDADGNVVKLGATGVYIPPAKRALMAGAHNEALQKRLKGLVNKYEFPLI